MGYSLQRTLELETTARVTTTTKPCQAPPGTYTIEIDRNKCEGKGRCVEVCPFHVFEVRRIEVEDFARLSFVGKLKSRAHGRITAYMPNLAACQACGRCVAACPEDALVLRPRTGS